MQTALFAGFLAVMIISAGLIYIGERNRRRKALQRWAATCGYKIMHARQPLLTEASPFRITGSKAQQTFRITVRDEKGSVRSGWILLGTPLRGLGSQRATLQWDE